MLTLQRTRTSVLAVAIACSLTLAACSSSGGKATTASTTRQPATSASAPAPTTTSPSTTAAPAPTGAPAPTTTAPPPTTVPVKPPLAREVGDLAGGSKGARTQAVQQALIDQKYDPGPADGSFGLKTSESVWAWQALHDLPRTGVVTADMERLILGRGTQRMLRPDLGPTHSEVDLARQVLLVFRAGQVALITHVSTGSGRHYCNMGSCGTAITGTGSFHFQRRIKGWRHAPLGLLYNPVYFNGGIAVHGEPSVPNYPASHGCVRIPMHIAEYFPGLVAKGDPIVVI